MRRADRLFQIINILRKHQPLTAKSLSETLEVSVRTIYRDINDLSVSGIPIYGEPGIGYQFLEGFELPPLTFSYHEIEALVLGARLVSSWGGPELTQAAASILQKVEAVTPENLKSHFDSIKLFSSSEFSPENKLKYLDLLRNAINEQKKLELSYTKETGEQSFRLVYPLGLFFWGGKWTLGTWCTLREAFREFRIDRIVSLEVMKDRFKLKKGQTLEDYFNILSNKYKE